MKIVATNVVASQPPERRPTATTTARANIKKKEARKMRQVNFNIKWKKLTVAKPFNPVTNICNLCTAEKYLIIFKPELGSLNKRDEIRNHCRHKTGLLLDKT